MICKNCGNQIDNDSKFCIKCGAKVEAETLPEAPQATEEKQETVLVMDVSRAVTSGKLNVYADKVEFVYTKDNLTVNETYHFYNITGFVAENSFKIPSIAVSLKDDEKMYFCIENEKSFDVYTQKALELNQIKEKSPSIDELGLTVSDMENELKENKEKRKSKIGKKVVEFFMQYKSFGSLSLKNKIIHIAIPALIILVFIGIFSLGGGASDEDYISCAKNVVIDELKSPATASFSNAEVVDKDEYGRVLVVLTVDAENSFGAYIRTSYAIVIKEYDKSTEKFVYYPYGVQRWTNSGLEDVYIEAAKDAANWDEPLEDD